MDLQGPTFEDLSIDDELSQLERVVRYSSSSIALQRLVHVKMLAETVKSVGFEQTVKSVVPLLGPLAADEELVVRQHLGEQLDDIARFCKSAGKEAGYRLIIEIVLPTLSKLLGDTQAEVRQAAGESLVGVAALMKPLDLGHHVLTIVLQLAHDDEQEELRMTAAALLNDLAESLGNDLCKQFVTPEMESLSEDPVFRVRKATALNLHKICKVVGEAGIQRLLPAYVRLTKDDVYRVRKACTEAMVEMSKAVGPEVSMRELTPVFLNLASDSSKLVRTGALQHLGRLISTLPGESVSQDLVQYFTSTAVESIGDPVADAELRLYCAFSFPAVVVTIGPERWAELRDSFSVLLRDPSWSVRKTLSYSLHEVAKVLKPSDVEQDLVPAMEAFLRDMEEVRLGVIRHLGDFFQEMSSQGRERHLNVLVEILQTTSPFNWRLRELLAQQLPRLASLLSLDSVFFSIVPVAFGLLNDPVAVVRENTFGVVAPLLQLAGAHSSARQASMVSRVRELAHAHSYQARQMYVYICHSMACNVNSPQERPQERALFIQEFVPSLAELARDAVVNVRIAMSRTLSSCPDWVMQLPEIRQAIRHLAVDSNPDVRHFVSFLPPILVSEPSQEEKQVAGVDTSSVLSDESVLTQWSVSTQRSVLSVGDFPTVKDGTSPNRSYKVNRQRSSSMESVGESGYSTTSSEGEGLRRLSSRRPPLPASWGLSGAGSSPVLPSPLYGAAAAGSREGDTSGSVSVPSAAGKVSEGPAAHSDVPSAMAEGAGWSGGKEETAGAIDTTAAVEMKRTDGGEMGEASAAGEETVGDEGRGVPSADDVLFDREADAEGGNGVGLLPLSPKRRATSQDAVVIEDDAVEDALIPPIVIATPTEETSPAVLPERRASLTLGEQAEVLAEANQEAMPPQTAPHPDPTPLTAPISRRRRGSGTSRPFEEHSSLWTGDEDDEEEDRMLRDESTEAGWGEGEFEATVEEQGGKVKLSPPPWVDGVRDPAAASLPSAPDPVLSFTVHAPPAPSGHAPPAPPNQAPLPPSSSSEASLQGSFTPALMREDAPTSTVAPAEGDGELRESVAEGVEAQESGTESLPRGLVATKGGGVEGNPSDANDPSTYAEGVSGTVSERDSCVREPEGLCSEQEDLASSVEHLSFIENANALSNANSSISPPIVGGAAGLLVSELSGRVALEEGPVVDEDGRKAQLGRENS